MTLLEVITVIVIIGILASMLVPIQSSLTANAQEASCLANLRGLYVAAQGYLQASGSWPQISPNLIVDDPKTYAHSWVDALEKYGAPHKAWICPAVQRSLGISMDAIDDPDNYRIDFIAAPFDDNPATPRLNPTQAWFVEKAGLHPRGNLVILANGTLTSLKDIVQAGLGN